jgi:predicted amidohydrolase YtcJ
MPHKADLIFTNARIFSGGPERPWTGAVAVRAGRVLYCGSAVEAQAWKGPATREIDARGGTLMPGIIDSHFHLLYGALNMEGMQLGAVSSYEELSAVVRAYAAEHPQESWLSGTGLRYNTGPGQTPLSRQHLDALAPDRPIYINAFDGHTSWANTRALELGGLLNGGDAGPNSEIVLDEQGQASGELREPGAFKPVSDLVPKPDRARKLALLRDALRLNASLGITSVHNMNSSPEEVGLYAELLEQGELTCRVYLPYGAGADTPIEALAGEALALKHRFSGDVLRAGSVKLFIDGVIEGYTGLLVDPYADRPETRGAANYEREHYQRMVCEADRLGLQVFTHATGDMGVRWALDACAAARQANGHADARHRIEHIELVHPSDLKRFGELGVIASMQPLHAPARVDELDIWPTRVGSGRWPFSFAWQDLRDAGATLIFGSDWPVVTQNPFSALAHALNRAAWKPGLPNQRQTLRQALLSYTRDAAFGEFQEHHKGRIQSGCLADLVLFEENLFELDPAGLAAARPLLTVMNGQVIYEKPGIP